MGKQYYLDVHIAYRQARLNATAYLIGYSSVDIPTSPDK
jgi:hypothetical protein